MISRFELTAGMPSTTRCIAEPVLMCRRSPAASSFARSGLRLIRVCDIEGHLIHDLDALPDPQGALLTVRLCPHHAVANVPAEGAVRECELYDLLVTDLGAGPLEGVGVDVDCYLMARGGTVQMFVLVQVNLVGLAGHELILPIAADLFVQLELSADVRELVKCDAGSRTRRVIGALIDMDSHQLFVHISSIHLGSPSASLAPDKPLIYSRLLRRLPFRKCISMVKA